MHRSFPPRDPVEGVPDRVGSRNGYGYVEGNPVNRTDPSGECWNTHPADDWRHQVCQDAFRQRFAISTADGRGYLPEGLDQHEVWGNLTYDEFKEKWNSAERIPLGEVAAGGVTVAAVGAATGAVPAGPDPFDLLIIGGVFAVTGGLICAGAIINSIAAYPRYDFAKGEEKAKARETAVPIPLDRIATPTNEPDEVVKLFRAVSFEEHADILKTGQFNEGPMWAMMGKWFAEHYEHAIQWGRNFYPSGHFRVVEVSMRAKVANRLHRASHMDGIGPARYATLEDLIEGVIAIRTVY